MKITHTPLKYLTAGLCLGAAALATDARGQASTDALIDQLLKKGVLTESEAKTLRAAPAKPVTAEANEVRLFWRDGLTYESRDKKTFKGKLGGRLDVDAGVFGEPDDIESVIGSGGSEAGVEFRRARISTEGEIGTALPTLYKVEVDFARAEVTDTKAALALKDVYLALAEIPAVGRFQVGHFKEPFSLELLTSANFVPFMERATPVEAFAPERNVGAMFQNAVLDQRMTWALGLFSESDDSGNSLLHEDWHATARLTGLPWYVEDAKGRQYLHLGLSGTFIDPTNSPAGDFVRYRSRPEAHLARRYVDTGPISASSAYQMSAEAAFVFGPFSAQGEYFHAWVDRPAGLETADFDGFYLLASYFLTGEHRPYRRAYGTFDRVKPNRNFGLKEGGGPGAWEVLLRYSQLDLNDGPITGGRLNDVTGGVTWYLNPNWKIMFNYVFAHLNRGAADGDAHIFETRFHVDF
jgi:phosphate-selective porin OprO and OprP